MRSSIPKRSSWRQAGNKLAAAGARPHIQPKLRLAMAPKSHGCLEGAIATMLEGKTPSGKVPGRQVGCWTAALPWCWWWGTTQAEAVQSSSASQNHITPVLTDGTSIPERSGAARKVAEGCRAGVGEASPGSIDTRVW